MVDTTTARSLYKSEDATYWVSEGSFGETGAFDVEHICLSILFQPVASPSDWAFATGCSRPGDILRQGQWLQIGSLFGGTEAFLLPDGIAAAEARQFVRNAGGELINMNLVVFPLDRSIASVTIQGPIGEIDLSRGEMP